MIDWQKYGPSYTVSPGIKKIGDLPIIEFDDQENRYLELKKKTKENIFFDPLFDKDKDQKVVNKIKEISKLKGWNLIRWITRDDNTRAKSLYDRVAEKTNWDVYELK